MSTTNVLTLQLMDFLVYQVRCSYLSDLPHSAGWQRVRLVRALEKIPPEAASLHDWNDTLDYLVQAPPEETAQAAREQLLSLLNCS